MTRSTDDQGFALPHRQTFDPSRWILDAMKPPEAVHIEDEEIVLYETPIFRLVLTHDTEIGIVESGGEMSRFSL